MTAARGAVVTSAARPPADPDRRRRAAGWTVALLLGLLATVPLALALGPVPVAPDVVAGVLGHHLFGTPETAGWTRAQDTIVWQVRTPRVVLGVVVGAGLAVSGVVLQALVRNVLAEPYLLGITSGASTGAAAAILFGVGVGIGVDVIAPSAFVGAALASVVVFTLARRGGTITPVRLLLAGVAVGYVLSAATSLLIFGSGAPDAARTVLYWLLGSLSLGNWRSVVVSGCVVACCLVVLMTMRRTLDALAIGDDTSRDLGHSPDLARARAAVVVAVCVGAVVAVSGGIGFVGLVVPHVARLCVGAVHSRVLPVAALIGALFLVWADVVARTVVQPAELPLGIVTALVGAPLLFVLVRRHHTSV
ncbi:ABC transporter permease [Pseudonocardia sp. CNS-139]|nr:ABC transporter permease [Pseudonocardia sp. CNS-139]